MKIINKQKNAHGVHNNPHNKIRLNGSSGSHKAASKSLFSRSEKTGGAPKVFSAIARTLSSLVIKLFSSAVNVVIIISMLAVIPTLWGWYVVPNTLIGKSGEAISVVLRFISADGVSLEYPSETGVTRVEYSGVKSGRAPSDVIYVRSRLKNIYEFAGESFTMPFESFSQAEPLGLGCMKRLSDGRVNRDDYKDGIKKFYIYKVTCDLTYDAVFNKIFENNKFAKSVSNLAIQGNDLFLNSQSLPDRLFNPKKAKDSLGESGQYKDGDELAKAIWQGTLSQMAAVAPWPLFGVESLFHLATSNKYGNSHYLQGLIAGKHVLRTGDQVFIMHGRDNLRFIFLQNNPD